MGMKSRSNWNLGMCLRVDCMNRTDDGCSDCFRFSNYKAVNEDGRQDSKGSRNNMRRDVSK